MERIFIIIFLVPYQIFESVSIFSTFSAFWNSWTIIYTHYPLSAAKTFFIYFMTTYSTFPIWSVFADVFNKFTLAIKLVAFCHVLAPPILSEFTYPTSTLPAPHTLQCSQCNTASSSSTHICYCPHLSKTTACWMSRVQTYSRYRQYPNSHQQYIVT